MRSGVLVAMFRDLACLATSDLRQGGHVALRPPDPPGEFSEKFRSFFGYPPTLQMARLAGKQ
eukprot:5656737-Pyramimonas_sp.AAC.1